MRIAIEGRGVASEPQTIVIASHHLLSKFRLMDALHSPASFLAITLYLPASCSVTSVISILEW